MFDLFDALTEEDKVKINNYISLHGAREEVMPLKDWLVNWSKNKVKLYKLLGNQLIHKIPYEINKPEIELAREFQDFYREEEAQAFDTYFYNFISQVSEKYNISYGLKQCFYRLTGTVALTQNKVGDNIRFEPPGKKILQIQAGAKPMKAVQKVINYFSDDVDKNFLAILQKKFEYVRIKHSLILNDNKVHGNLVFSIHPLDFMTMSDNNSWSSCMSWINSGCYRIGTVEMMNSNNVVCCYLEGKDPFYFGLSKKVRNDAGKIEKKRINEPEEDFTWGQKKWRQLVYVTKDIIVSGKPYPFKADEISKDLVKKLRELAKENLNWTYSFGVEEYGDMTHINGAYSMNRARHYIEIGDATKHNILFDTKGMYNDMLNDSKTTYWCVRNKVKHTKIISYSGKATCLCCGGDTLIPDDSQCYNDRFMDTSQLICPDCIGNYTCDSCNSQETNKIHIDLVINGKKKRFCSNCVRDYVRFCPCCGKPMEINEEAPEIFYVLDDKERENVMKGIVSQNIETAIEQSWYKWDYGLSQGIWYEFSRMKIDPLASKNLVIPVFMHSDCATKSFCAMPFEHTSLVQKYWNNIYRTFKYSLIATKIDNYEDYLLENLRPVDSVALLTRRELIPSDEKVFKI